MPRGQSPAVRTTLYRMVKVPTLLDGVRAKYLEDSAHFTWEKARVGDREAVLVSGSMETEIVPWAETLYRLTSQELTLGNRTAAAVLLIRNAEDGAWALTYGMGFHLLEQAKVDPGFGQRIAIRTADPNELNSLTRTTLDHRSRTDRLSIPSGEHLRGFGVGDFGELVTRLVVKAKIEGITAGAGKLGVRGAAALNMPLGRAPEALLADLDVVDSILAQPAPTELEVLEQLVAIKHQPELRSRLEVQFAEALGGDDTVGRLALSWPHERVDENGTPSSFKLLGAGNGRTLVQDGIPDLATITTPLDGFAGEERLAKLDRMKIILFRDAEGTAAISGAIPARKWLAFETRDRGRYYSLHDGSWYLMASDYAEKLGKRVQAIFDRDAPVHLPSWPADSEGDEAWYNQMAARELSGAVLDRRLIYTEFHRRGIEVCDILLPDGVLVHVKNLEKSAPASHLIAQALVSADCASARFSRGAAW